MCKSGKMHIIDDLKSQNGKRIKKIKMLKRKLMSEDRKLLSFNVKNKLTDQLRKTMFENILLDIIYSSNIKTKTPRQNINC